MEMIPQSVIVPDPDGVTLFVDAVGGNILNVTAFCFHHYPAKRLIMLLMSVTLVQRKKAAIPLISFIRQSMLKWSMKKLLCNLVKASI